MALSLQSPNPLARVFFGLLGTIDIEGHYETSEKVDRVYKNPDIKNANYQPKLKLAAIDIEASRTNNKFGRLYVSRLHTTGPLININIGDVISIKNQIGLPQIDG